MSANSMKAAVVRTPVLAIALTIAALLTNSKTAKAQADNGPTDPGVRCAAKVGPGQYEFYLPGEKATDVNGNKWVCGPDGQWFRDYSALTLGGATKAGYTLTASYVIASSRYTAIMR